MSVIEARSPSTHKGYLLNGLVWFVVPFSLATSLGLGAFALDLPIMMQKVVKGLVPLHAPPHHALHGRPGRHPDPRRHLSG
jgi:hypothetical protein